MFYHYNKIGGKTHITCPKSIPPETCLLSSTPFFFFQLLKPKTLEWSLASFFSKTTHPIHQENLSATTSKYIQNPTTSHHLYPYHSGLSHYHLLSWLFQEPYKLALCFHSNLPIVYLQHSSQSNPIKICQITSLFNLKFSKGSLSHSW